MGLIDILRLGDAIWEEVDTSRREFLRLVGEAIAGALILPPTLLYSEDVFANNTAWDSSYKGGLLRSAVDSYQRGRQDVGDYLTGIRRKLKGFTGTPHFKEEDRDRNPLFWVIMAKKPHGEISRIKGASGKMLAFKRALYGTEDMDTNIFYNRGKLRDIVNSCRDNGIEGEIKLWASRLWALYTEDDNERARIMDNYYRPLKREFYSVTEPIRAIRDIS
jgi:hypothetical protein